MSNSNTDSKKLDAILLACSHLVRNDECIFSLEQCLAAIIAETIFRFEWQEIVELNQKYNIATFIKHHCNTNKYFKELKKYTRDSLYLLIEKKYEENLIGRRDLLPKYDWAYEYRESEQVLLNGFMDKKQKAKNNGKAYPTCELSNYGKEMYVDLDDNETNDTIVEEIDNTSKLLNNKTLESSQFYTDENIESEDVFVQQDIKYDTQEIQKIKDEIIDLYEALVAARGGKEAITQYEYIWQWRISKSEYQEIKKLLLSDACKKNIKEICKTNAHCRFIIVIYIAERYKREWNGSDGEDNALIQVGLDCDDIVGLVEQYFAKNLEKIYYSETEEGRRYTERLDSLRLEGGLPINYIVGCQNQNNLRSFSEKLYLDENDAINVLNNKTIKYSYEKQYSIYKYICLIKQDLFSNIFSAEDLDDGLYKDFIELLKEGRKKAQKKSNKFEYKYDLIDLAQL